MVIVSRSAQPIACDGPEGSPLMRWPQAGQSKAEEMAEVLYQLRNESATV